MSGIALRIHKKKLTKLRLRVTERATRFFKAIHQTRVHSQLVEQVSRVDDNRWKITVVIIGEFTRSTSYVINLHRHLRLDLTVTNGCQLPACITAVPRRLMCVCVCACVCVCVCVAGCKTTRMQGARFSQSLERGERQRKSNGFSHILSHLLKIGHK